jgi:hypothetical protein
MAVALPVRWNIQMLKAKPDMLLARMETSCPAQTIVKPAIPPGCFNMIRLVAFMILLQVFSEILLTD